MDGLRDPFEPLPCQQSEIFFKGRPSLRLRPLPSSFKKEKFKKSVSVSVLELVLTVLKRRSFNTSFRAKLRIVFSVLEAYFGTKYGFDGMMYGV